MVGWSLTTGQGVGVVGVVRVVGVVGMSFLKKFQHTFFNFLCLTNSTPLSLFPP